MMKITHMTARTTEPRPNSMPRKIGDIARDMHVCVQNAEDNEHPGQHDEQNSGMVSEIDE